MLLKGANHEYEGDPAPDRWQLNDELIATGERWGISSERDLAHSHS